MTPLFFLAMYALGVLMTVIRHPIYGVYTYLFTFYMDPANSWWSDNVPGLRYMFIVAAVTLVTSIRSEHVENRPQWYSFKAAKLFIAMVVLMWCQYFWAINQEVHLEGTIEYSKHLIMFYLIYRFFNTREKIMNFLLANVVGCFWFGYQALDASGGRLESIGGPVGGANELGIHVTTAMVTGGIMWMVLKGWKKWLVFVCIPFVANTIILTVSRGAFLGFFFAGMVGAMYIPKVYRGQYIGLSVLAVILISMLAHDDLKERFYATFTAVAGEEEIDNSAASRLDIFKANIRMGVDYPFGSGYRGSTILSPFYMEERFLAKESGLRSSHNTFAAVFSEHGYLGAFLYVSIILWVIKMLFRIHRVGEHRMSSIDRAFAVAIIAALLGMYVSGNFSNSLFTETQYWLLSLLCSLLATTLDKTAAENETDALKNKAQHSEPSPYSPSKADQQIKSSY